MSPASPDIGIGITTKNRWEDLAVTLEGLRAAALDGLETMVADDGSDQTMPADFPVRFPWVKFERFEHSEGVTVRRNHLAQSLTAEFYLSLDDDSFPVAGDLAAAADFLRGHPGVFALTFEVIMRDAPVPSVVDATPPTLTKAFVGCAALLRRELVTTLGGFERRLHFYHEEPELCFRAFQRGFDVLRYPGVVVRHMVAPGARQSASRVRYFVRNIVLLDLWYYPMPGAWARALGHGLLLYLRMPRLRPHPVALFLGWAEGFLCYFRWAGLRRRLTRDQLAAWEGRANANQTLEAKARM